MSKRQSCICTIAKDGKIDIAIIDNERKEYDLCLDCTDTRIDFFDEHIVARLVEPSDFEKRLARLKKKIELDFSKRNPELFERFYTTSKISEDLVDLIEIDITNKKYNLYINHIDTITDGYTKYGESTYSFYVSRSIFDILVSAIKSSDFEGNESI